MPEGISVFPPYVLFVNDLNGYGGGVMLFDLDRIPVFPILVEKGFAR